MFLLFGVVSQLLSNCCLRCLKPPIPNGSRAYIKARAFRAPIVGARFLRAWGARSLRAYCRRALFARLGRALLARLGRALFARLVRRVLFPSQA